MELLLGALGLIALGTCLVSGLWLLVIAFRTSIGWGLAYMFIPFAGIAFVVMHWDKTRKPFIGFLGGLAIAGGVASLVPATLAHMFTAPETSVHSGK